jgi:hypothetical protein
MFSKSKIIKYLLLLGILTQGVGCGQDYVVDLIKKVYAKVATHVSIEAYGNLQATSDLYKQALPGEMDENGFIFTDTCDSLLWTGLVSAADPAVNVNIQTAESNGQWFRRPNHDCGPQWGNSRSTISRDQILGLYWFIWKHQDLKLAISIYNTWYNNNWLMTGTGTPGELLLSSTEMSELALMIQRMGGSVPDMEAMTLLPVSWDTTPGYISHLTVWHILLEGDIRGYISQDELNVLTTIYNSNHGNPLFSAAYHKYTDGNFQEAMDELNHNTQWYPQDHLPNNSNYCSIWLPETTYGSGDTNPCINTAGPGDNKGFELMVINELVIH